MDIFCIRKKNEIVSLADFQNLISKDVEEAPVSRYILSSLITPDEERILSFKLIKAIDKRIDYWIQERRYLRRLIISSIVFLLLYFLCSLTIRDPLPLIDELLVGFAGAIIAWRFISKRDLEAIDAKRQKDIWHKSIIDAELSYSSAMEEIESYCQNLEDIGFKELIERIADGTLDRYRGERLDGLKSALDSVLCFSKKLEKRYIAQIYSKKIAGYKLKKHLLQDYTLGNLDLYFLAFYLGYSKEE